MSRRPTNEPLDANWERSWSEAIGQRSREVAGGEVDTVDADEVHREIVAELRQRAADAISGRNPSFSLADSIARARAAVEAIRSGKP